MYKLLFEALKKRSTVQQHLQKHTGQKLRNIIQNKQLNSSEFQSLILDLHDEGLEADKKNNSDNNNIKGTTGDTKDKLCRIFLRKVSIE